VAKDFIPSPQQRAVFDFVSDPRGGNAIIEAVAGAGKTTTLVKACERMRGSVYLGAYNSKMGKELKERTAHLRGVRAGTLHSAGFNQLRRHINIVGDPDGKKVLKLVENWCHSKGRMDVLEIAPALAGIVSMAKQRGIGVPGLFADTHDEWMQMIYHFGLDEDLPEDFEDKMDSVVKLARVILRRSSEVAREQGLIDFDDMVYLPLLWNLRMFQNDWVLIDEAQDTNPTRRALAARMVKMGGRLIAVGDPHQAIYGFSGADNDALAQIGAQFKAKTLPLTVTYRCPKSVVAVAQRFVGHIHAHETAPEGTVTGAEYKNIVDLVAPGDAILCRYNKYLVNLCFKLIRNGKPARIEGRSIGQGLVALAGKWKVKDTETLAGRVANWMKREVKKATDAKNDAKADQIADRAETLLVLIERAQEEGITTPAALKRKIAEMFDDNVADKAGMITLCSVHRSKGLEFPRVFILGLDELMGRECRQPWQTEQEINLQYVAVTRAQQTLVLVEGIKEEGKQHHFDADEEEAA